jgi:hypothetical protein
VSDTVNSGWDPSENWFKVGSQCLWLADMQLNVEKRKKKKMFSVSSQMKGQDFTPPVSEPPSGASSSQESSPYMAHVSHIVSQCPVKVDCNCPI